MSVKVVVHKNEYGEYEVPCSDIDGWPDYEDDDGMYYTDDRDDAIATAQSIYGDDVVLTIAEE